MAIQINSVRLVLSTYVLFKNSSLCIPHSFQGNYTPQVSILKANYHTQNHTNLLYYIEMTTLLLKESDLTHGANIIKDGGTVAFRTETVYGLGADATNDEAIKKIFIAKNRPQSNPLIIHFHSIQHIQEYLDIPLDVLPLFSKVKAALTIVLPYCRGGILPSVVNQTGIERISPTALSNQNTIAVRIPSCKFAQKFIHACGVPLAAPSANTSTRPSPTRWQDVHNDLDGRIDGIFMGKQTKIGIESTVVLYNEGKLEILRQGGISANQLSKLAKIPVKILQSGENLSKSPGTRFKHYSPSVPVKIIIPNQPNLKDLINDKQVIILCLTQNKKRCKKLLANNTKLITLGNSAKHVQTNLFAAFREAEKLLAQMNNKTEPCASTQLILIEQMPQTEDFSSINERISKASNS